MEHKFSVLFIRLSLVYLYGWFAVKQLLDATSWVSLLPTWTGYFPIPGEMLVRLNGWFEFVAASLLLLGVRVKIVAIVLGLHLLLIAIELGGAIGVRDFALAIVTLSFAFMSPDEWTLDAKAA